MDLSIRLAAWQSLRRQSSPGPSVHNSAIIVRRRSERLSRLEVRVQKQIADADCLLAALEDYCRENPDDPPCVANDPTWTRQLGRHREDLAAMLLAIQEKIQHPSVRRV